MNCHGEEEEQEQHQPVLFQHDLATMGTCAQLHAHATLITAYGTVIFRSGWLRRGVTPLTPIFTSPSINDSQGSCRARGNLGAHVKQGAGMPVTPKLQSARAAPNNGELGTLRTSGRPVAALLGLYWGPWGPGWVFPGVFLGTCGTFWGFPGGHRQKRVCGQLALPLRSPQNRFLELCWGSLGGLRGHLRALLCPFQGHIEALEANRKRNGEKANIIVTQHVLIIWTCLVVSLEGSVAISSRLGAVFLGLLGAML